MKAARADRGAPCEAEEAAEAAVELAGARNISRAEGALAAPFFPGAAAPRPTGSKARLNPLLTGVGSGASEAEAGARAEETAARPCSAAR